MNIKRPQRPLSPPLVFKLGRREVAQRGVDALVKVDFIEKPTQLAARTIAILVLRHGSTYAPS